MPMDPLVFLLTTQKAPGQLSTRAAARDPTPGPGSRGVHVPMGPLVSWPGSRGCYGAIQGTTIRKAQGASLEAVVLYFNHCYPPEPETRLNPR